MLPVGLQDFEAGFLRHLHQHYIEGKVEHV